MNQPHLSENELQQFALEQQHADHKLAAHVQECSGCSTAIANYRAMFLAISAMEKPVFNFALEKQVLSQLPVLGTPKASFPWYSILIGGIAVAILAIPLLIMRNFFAGLFMGIPVIVLDIIVVTVLSIVVFQCREMLAAHRTKMRLLNYY